MQHDSCSAGDGLRLDGAVAATARALVSVVAILGPVGATQAAAVDSGASGDWSAATTWVDGVVPGEGDSVRILSGHTVRYDLESDAVIESVLVSGALVFSVDRDTRLETGLLVLAPEDQFDSATPCAVHVHDAAPDPRPRLEIGSAQAPVDVAFTATIRLHAVAAFDADCAPALISHGGDVVMHGAAITPTWTKLAATTAIGATQLPLAEPVNWRPGDRVIVVGTQIPPGRMPGHTIRGGELRPQTEERVVAAVTADGLGITLDQPLAFSHRGGGPAEDRRGEVANLSRNVVIESAEPAGTRGHTMFHRFSTAAISYTEFRHLGKEGLLGRYPLHFHLVDDSMRGSFVEGASIWDSANRWLSIHGAEFLVVRNTIGFGSVGHGFFLENSAEVYNLLAGNLGVQSYVSSPLPGQALAYDGNLGACYWAANARNFVFGNTFAECDNEMSFILEYSPEGPMPVTMLHPDGNRASVDARAIAGGLVDGLEVHTTWGWGPWIRDARFPADDPMLFRNSRIWRTHYPADISGDNVVFDGVRMLDSTYGFYNQFPGPHLVRNAWFDNIGPHGAIMTYLGGHGSFLYENITLQRTLLAFRMDAKAEIGTSGQPMIHHVRNITNLTPQFTNSAGSQVSAWTGTEDANGRTNPLLLLVHHDAVAPGIDRLLMPAAQSETLPGVPEGLTFTDATGITDEGGVFLEGRGVSKYAEGGIEWPASVLEAPADALPPATTILRPRDGVLLPAGDDTLEVCGVSLDQGGVAGVTVNGVPATLDANGYDWCATLTDLPPGSLEIAAAATDTAGNAELFGHTIAVTFPAPEPPPDSDADGVPDGVDNCVARPNGSLLPDAGGHSQRDSDSDSIGNVCDADLNNDGLTNVTDLAIFRLRFGTTDADADFDGNGTVNAADLARFRVMFGQPPGPSGLQAVP